MNCVFCKIAAKDIPSEIIYEDEHALAFLDINPLTEGHLVVIPKVHAENILDLPEEEVGPVFKVVRDMTSLLKKTLSPIGFTIGINHGSNLVDHLHIHIIPRYAGDGGGSIHSIVKFPPKEPLRTIKNKIIGA
ncbi:MAG: HIT family protein [Candidatus Colwellbacteria bacterium]|nr:HIT family protein [Candidatus Colwellbacteria bacterium]